MAFIGGAESSYTDTPPASELMHAYTAQRQLDTHKHAAA